MEYCTSNEKFDQISQHAMVDKINTNSSRTGIKYLTHLRIFSTCYLPPSYITALHPTVSYCFCRKEKDHVQCRGFRYLDLHALSSKLFNPPTM